CGVYCGSLPVVQSVFSCSLLIEYAIAGNRVFNRIPCTSHACRIARQFASARSAEKIRLTNFTGRTIQSSFQLFLVRNRDKVCHQTGLKGGTEKGKNLKIPAAFRPRRN